MDRISKVFQSARKDGRKVFIPFVTAGDPDLEMTRSLVTILEKNGADIIELGVPFSDPLADGPVIQRASHRALAKGATLRKICHFIEGIRKDIKIPIALMSYYNPVLRPGLDETFRWMVDAGVDGLICPDLPPEEGEELISLGQRHGIAVIFFLAPTSTMKRISLVAEKATGFIYYVSVTGVTGARDDLPLSIRDHIKEIRSVTDMPVAVGFGVSTPEHAARIAEWADGVIVGSAIINILEENGFSEHALDLTGDFAAKIKHAMEDRIS